MGRPFNRPITSSAIHHVLQIFLFLLSNTTSYRCILLVVDEIISNLRVTIIDDSSEKANPIVCISLECEFIKLLVCTFPPLLTLNSVSGFSKENTLLDFSCFLNMD